MAPGRENRIAGSKGRLIKIAEVLAQLEGIVFASLERPQVPRGSPPTPELVNWAVRMYCFSSLSHCREMLRSFLLLTKNGRIPATFVVSRCLFELGAQSYYVHKHLTQYLGSKELRSAWKFLSEINMGNRYMNEYGGRGGNKESSFPAVREVKKMIRAWGELTKQDMRRMYSSLSEFAHPNMAAFSHYYKMKARDGRKVIVSFPGPSEDPGTAPLAEVSMSLGSILYFGTKLLDITSETDVRTKLAAALRDLMQNERPDGDQRAPPAAKKRG